VESKTYTLRQQDEKADFELVPTTLKELPKVIYGDLDGVADRILTTFKERNTNLGALFSGLKGNSKTVTCSYICQKAEGIPTILITEPFTGEKFKSYITGLDNYIIFFDEFEKVYDTVELQNELLTILDGAVGGKKLFLFTSNSEKISTYLKNRPNRIFYHYKYYNLEQDVVDDIMDKELKEKQFEKEIRNILEILGTVSYDVLLNLIDEVNRFKESPKKLIKAMNIQVEQTNFRVILLLNGKRFTATVDFNPLTVENFFIDYKSQEGWWRYFTDAASNYTMYTSKGTFIFESDVNKLYFTPFKPYTMEIL
jgi:hypothetical protein